LKLFEIAKLIGAEIVRDNDKDIEILGLAPIQSATNGHLSFVASAEYQKFLATTGAAAVIVKKPDAQLRCAQLVHANPYLAFAKAGAIFARRPKDYEGVSPQAFVHPTAQIGEDVTIYPFAYIGPHVRIGARCRISSGCFLGPNVLLGSDCELGANVVLQYGVQIGNRVLIHPGSVIGADGFGFAVGDGEIVKIPQVGTVVIDDDVEVGAVCTVDRAALDRTSIGQHTKLDSKVHVGHNVQIGHHTMLSALTGLAGSSEVGNWVLMGGHSGASNQIKIQDRCKVGAMSGVVQETVEGETYMGFPAQPAKDWRKQVVLMRKLPKLDQEIRDLRRRLAELESRTSNP
jgi:UDP-3-O-[3-hydroxymyristoyl] glucosamine N-acyltransferase